MADRRDRRKVLVVRVREHRAPREQPVQALLVLRPEAQQIIVAELIDGDGHYQFWLFRRDNSGRDNEHRKEDCKCTFQNFLWFPIPSSEKQVSWKPIRL